MKTEEYTFVDKSKWERGEWDKEPDKIQFEDPETKLPCLIVRGPSGALCGYVGVSEGHPFFGLDYSSCSLKEAKPRGQTEGDDVWSLSGKTQKKSEWMIERQRKQIICSENGWCSHTPESMLEVHGGITFSDFCQERADNHGICHNPSEGEPDKVWWLGFDCAHCNDASPAYDNFMPKFGYRDYRTVDYVKSEITKLAKQLFAMEKQNG